MTTLQTPLTVATTATASAALVAGRHTPVDATSGVKTMTLPTPANVGARLRVEKIDTSANVVNVTGTIRGTGSSTLVLAGQYEQIELVAESLTSWRPSGSYRILPDATATVKGVVQLAGDLAGTAAAPTVPGLSSKADVSYVDSSILAAGKLSAFVPTLTGGAYTTIGADLSRLLDVTTGASDATITLLSAATAGEGSIQYVRKGDTGAGKVIVSDGTNPRAWLNVQYDYVSFRSTGSAWEAIDVSIAPLMVRYTTAGAVTVPIPPLARRCDAGLIGAGGGGGSGRRGAASSIRTGGGGGVGGNTVRSLIPVASVGTPGTSVSAQVGTGAAGGAAVTVDSTNGSGGASSGGTIAAARTTFAGLRAEGGNSGSGGQTSNASGGASFASGSTWGSTPSGPASSSTANGTAPGAGATGVGAAGGSADATNNQRLPGPGGNGSSAAGTQTAGGAAGTTGTAGGAGGSVTDATQQIGGAGGGGGYFATGAVGTNGGDGGTPGGGGAGGAAADNSFNSGAGGKGGDGEIRLIWLWT